ncbi:MAG: sugar transferase (PEP-CTERM/EpsH1 system associated), partial [Gammaproteobacteria bacterium]
KTSNTKIFSLTKRPGNDVRALYRLYRLLKREQPNVLHTRNFGALEAQMIGAMLRIPMRVHGEHGWDVDDLTGARLRSRLVRRVVGRTVHRFITVSVHLKEYLINTAKVPENKVTQIYNGVDDRLFRPVPEKADPDHIVIGTVGRMQTVKNQILLVEAFIRLVEMDVKFAGLVRLRMVGDGPLLSVCANRLEAAGVAKQTELIGASNNVATELRNLDIFVLPSLAEGISNTVLEAMATGLPVVATNVGGNSELVVDGETGAIVRPNDYDHLAETLRRYVDDEALRTSHGEAARQRVSDKFSLKHMVQGYDMLYKSVAQTARANA